MNKLATLTKGIIKENPVLVLVLGTCPTLATSTQASNAIGMGIAALAYVFLMVFSFTLPSKEVLGTMSAAEINAIRVTPWIMTTTISS